MMTPQEYIAHLRLAIESQDWLADEEFRYEVCQVFANTREWSNLKNFFSEVLTAGVTPDVENKVRSCLGNIANLKNGMNTALSMAISKADANPSIRALYFEYDLGGGEDSDGNFFLCQQYSVDPQDNDWASSFRVNGIKRDGIVDGPNIYAYFNYDPDFEFSNQDTAVANAYGFACLLAILGETIDRLQYRRLPIGFAEHDSPAIIHIKP